VISPRDPQDPVQVAVAEAALRVELVAQPHELLEPRVERPQVVGGEVVLLAPVRAPARRAAHLGHGAEPLLVRRPDVGVRRDVAGVAAGRRRQRDVVGRAHPHLDRERHLQAEPLRQVPQLAHHRGDRLARDGPLGLAEAHPRGLVNTVGAAST
jgi:hypothetical protein